MLYLMSSPDASWCLQDENEVLQSKLHKLTKALRQQEINNQVMKNQLHRFEAAEGCQAEDL